MRKLVCLMSSVVIGWMLILSAGKEPVSMEAVRLNPDALESCELTDACGITDLSGLARSDTEPFTYYLHGDSVVMEHGGGVRMDFLKMDSVPFLAGFEGRNWKAILISGLPLTGIAETDASGDLFFSHYLSEKFYVRGDWSRRFAAGTTLVIEPGDTITDVRCFTLSFKGRAFDSAVDFDTEDSSAQPFIFSTTYWLGPDSDYPVAIARSMEIPGTHTADIYVFPRTERPSEKNTFQNISKYTDPISQNNGIFPGDKTDRIAVTQQGAETTVVINTPGNSQSSSLIIADIQGRVFLHTGTPSSGTFTVRLLPGEYIATLLTPSETTSCKFIVLKTVL